MISRDRDGNLHLQGVEATFQKDGVQVLALVSGTMKPDSYELDLFSNPVKTKAELVKLIPKKED